ncbi:broad substrate specificity ATP-binding cassette transporter ABCG2-like [Ciona intestinalis]
MESLQPDISGAPFGSQGASSAGESVYFTAKSEEDLNSGKSSNVAAVVVHATDKDNTELVESSGGVDRMILGQDLNAQLPLLVETGKRSTKSSENENRATNLQNSHSSDAAVLLVNEESNQPIGSANVTDALLTSTPALYVITNDDDVIETAVKEAAATPLKKRNQPVRRFSLGGIPKIFISPATPRASPISGKRKMSLLSCTRVSSIDYALTSEDIEELDLTTRTLGEVCDVRGAIILSYHDVTMKVRVIPKVKEAIGYCYGGVTPKYDKTSVETGDKVILDGVSGIFHPGINAIMGPSGSGKTTLLEILAGRKSGRGIGGRVMVNGQPIATKFCQKTGYAPQKDILNPGLTVREHIWYSLCLRRPDSLTEAEKCLLLGEIISSLDLLKCADSKVGNATCHNISGGERKRTAIAMELASAPKILFLDEPTSKLDSSTSKALVQLLKKLSDNGRTIILTIHQPSYAIYRMFDSLTLIAKGRTVYHGSAELALSYFSSIGFTCEKYNSPPDYFLDVLYGVYPHKPPTPRLTFTRPTITPSRSLRRSIFHRSINNNEDSRRTATDHYLDDSVFCNLTPTFTRFAIGDIPRSYSCELDITTEEGAKAHADIGTHLAEAYVTSQQNFKNRQELAEIEKLTKRTLGYMSEHKSFKMHKSNKNLSFGHEYTLLTRRALKSSTKIFAALGIMNAVIGLIFGILYFYNEDSHPTVQNRLGMFFYLSVHGVMVPAMITAKSFAVNEKSLFRHERRGGFYRASTYCLARCTVVLLARVLSAVVFSGFVYWMTGLQRHPAHFMSFLMTAFFSGFACDGICLYAALAFRSFSTGRLFVVLYMTLTSVFAGFLLDLNEAFPWLAWVKYISVTRYCYLGWVINEFIEHDLEPCPRLFTEKRNQHALMIKERLTSIQNAGRNGRTKMNITSCTYYPGDAVLPMVVGDDEIFLHKIWLTDVILLLMAVFLFVACFLRMRKM